MVSDALNNNMLENKYTTATAVPAFNRVWLSPPRNRYMISISWVPKWKINQLSGCNVGGMGGGACMGSCVWLYNSHVHHSLNNNTVHFENQFSSNRRVCITATAKRFSWQGASLKALSISTGFLFNYKFCKTQIGFIVITARSLCRMNVSKQKHYCDQTHSLV